METAQHQPCRLYTQSLQSPACGAGGGVFWPFVLVVKPSSLLRSAPSFYYIDIPRAEPHPALSTLEIGVAVAEDAAALSVQDREQLTAACRERWVYDLERLTEMEHAVTELWDPADPRSE